MIQIPTFTDSEYTERVTLDGIEYAFLFSYSTREEVWYMSLFATDGTPIASSVKLVCNYRLMQRNRHPSLPSGLLVVLSTGSDEPPKQDELGEGKRCGLMYLTKEEVDAL